MAALVALDQITQPAPEAPVALGQLFLAPHTQAAAAVAVAAVVGPLLRVVALVHQARQRQGPPTGVAVVALVAPATTAPLVARV